jgi:hypothetical protein
LLPAYILFRDARVAGEVPAKNDWGQGVPLSRFLGNALRHMFAWMDGAKDEDHLAAARWHIAGLLWTEETIRRGKLPAELNDLPETNPASGKPHKPVPRRHAGVAGGRVSGESPPLARIVRQKRMSTTSNPRPETVLCCHPLRGKD